MHPAKVCANFLSDGADYPVRKGLNRLKHDRFAARVSPALVGKIET